MKLFITVVGLALAGLTACSKSKPIESAEVVGEWQAANRWGKGPMTGSVVFRADGTCETINLPWGTVTGKEADLKAIESVSGNWVFEVKEGERVVCLKLGAAKSTGQTCMTWITPQLRSGQWTFRQYIGDPDLMDIVEFEKQPASPSTEKR